MGKPTISAFNPFMGVGLDVLARQLDMGGLGSSWPLGRPGAEVYNGLDFTWGNPKFPLSTRGGVAVVLPASCLSVPLGLFLGAIARVS